MLNGYDTRDSGTHLLRVGQRRREPAQTIGVRRLAVDVDGTVDQAVVQVGEAAVDRAGVGLRQQRLRLQQECVRECREDVSAWLTGLSTAVATAIPSTTHYTNADCDDRSTWTTCWVRARAVCHSRAGHTLSTAKRCSKLVVTLLNASGLAWCQGYGGHGFVHGLLS